MNKKMLIDVVSEKLGTTKKNADAAVTAVFAAITEAMVGGNDVKVSGFGTFSVAERAARIGRNPATGESIKIEASKSPKFKASKTLKDAIKA